MKKATNSERAAIVQMVCSLFPIPAYLVLAVTGSFSTMWIVAGVGLVTWLVAMVVSVILVTFEAWKKTGPWIRSYRWYVLTLLFAAIQCAIITPRL